MGKLGFNPSAVFCSAWHRAHGQHFGGFCAAEGAGAPRGGVWGCCMGQGMGASRLAGAFLAGRDQGPSSH